MIVQSDWSRPLFSEWIFSAFHRYRLSSGWWVEDFHNDSQVFFVAWTSMVLLLLCCFSFDLVSMSLSVLTGREVKRTDQNERCLLATYEYIRMYGHCVGSLLFIGERLNNGQCRDGAPRQSLCKSDDETEFGRKLDGVTLSSSTIVSSEAFFTSIILHQQLNGYDQSFVRVSSFHSRAISQRAMTKSPPKTISTGCNASTTKWMRSWLCSNRGSNV